MLNHDLPYVAKMVLQLEINTLRDEDIRVAELRNLNAYKESISKIKLSYPNFQARDEP